MSGSTQNTAYVYFVQAGDDPAVMIGSTVPPLATRLKYLQTANHRELHLIGAIDVMAGIKPAGLTIDDIRQMAVKLERQIHRQFAADRIHGQWFTLTDDLRKLIKQRSNISRL